MKLKDRYENYCKGKSPYSNYIVLVCFMALFIIKINTISVAWCLFLIVFGFVFWGLNEYFFHRFIFHLKTKQLKSIVFMLHGVHHKHLNETNNLPFLHALFLYGIYFLFALLINSEIVYSFFIGIFIGIYWLVYVYDTIHKTNINKLIRLRKHHAIHHCYSNYNFGTTTVFWDKLFHTFKNN